MTYFRILQVNSLPVARDLSEEAAAGDSSVVLEEFVDKKWHGSGIGVVGDLGCGGVCRCGGPGT